MEGGRDGVKRRRLNVGGKVLETSSSLLLTPLILNSLSISSPSDDTIFLDRDPALFSAILSLIRSPGAASSRHRRFPSQLLLDEALFYGLHPLLLSALAPPPLLGFSSSLTSTLSPASEPFPTALSASDGSLCLAHGAGLITSYSSTLDHLITFRTHLDRVTSLRQLPQRLAAIGSLASPGLHLYNLHHGHHVASVHWSDPSDLRVHKAKVTAIATRPAAATDNTPILAAFECPHWENCILVVDPVTLQARQEVGRQSGSAAKSAAPGRVAHLQELGLVFASAVSTGAFGYSGYMRLWDPRSGDAVWETSEPGGAGRSSRFGDPFSDADVDAEQLAIYKVCSKSGDIGVADLRRLGNDPWVYLSSGPRGSGGGRCSVLHCYKNQVFVSRKDGLEVWSQLEEQQQGMGNGDDEQARAKGGLDSKGICERRFRSNYADTEEDTKRGIIQMMEGDGDRLFLTREGMHGVEVWESSHLAGAISLS